MDVKKVKIIGAGLAGAEAALVLSRICSKFKIELIEMRPKTKTPVHKTSDCSELVCSNSFKSMKPSSAAGMLKRELAGLGSPVFECALNSKVDAGAALAVDRNEFSSTVTSLINESNNVSLVRHEATDIFKEKENCDALILATGPLTSTKLSDSIISLTGHDKLAFYDAAAPIVMADSIDISQVFTQDRYGSSSSGDYLNAPFDRDEYESFIDELINAKCAILHDFEKRELFQACQPIEQVARTGIDAPRYGALKPVGLNDPNTGRRPWAVVQLRAENSEKTAYNLVGFQTNLTFSEQKRVFRMIPGLQNAEFARYGVMHKNTFINAPSLLTNELCLRSNSNIYVAGQLCGTEGYLEAVRSGHHTALCVASSLLGVGLPELPKETVFGALIDYATNPDTKNYQPMHVNFGLMKLLDRRIRNKKERYETYAKRGNAALDEYVNNLIHVGFMDSSAERKAASQIMKLNESWIVSTNSL